MSIDGYIDTAADERLVLSNDADLDRVDAVRADSDAILVGAATLRNDNPRLLVRAPSRRAERIARGLPPTPIKVTVTSRGLSLRTVSAPTRIASQEARTASTRSKSASLDSSSRRGVGLPR